VLLPSRASLARGLDLPVLGFKTTALVGSLQAAHDVLTRRRIQRTIANGASAGRNCAPGRVRREAIEAICELNHELLRPATKRWWRPCAQLPGATAGIALRSERIPGVLDRAHEALGKRHPKSRSRGRRGVPAEARARSARQSGVPRLHACGQRQGARRQDHGPLGRGGGAAGAGTGSRQDGGHRPTLLAQPGRPPGGALLRRRR